MQFRGNRRFSVKALNARGTELVLEKRARELAPGVAARTRERTGETRASTRVETNHRSASGDRPAVRIVQDGAPVPENFRQNRDYMLLGLGDA